MSAADETGLPLANGFLKAQESGKPEEVFLWIGKNEQNNAAVVQAFLDTALQQVTDRLAGRVKSTGLSNKQLMRLAALLEKCSDYCMANVGPKHIFSMLAAGSLELLNRNEQES